jgi:hypothetical protein
VIALVGSVLGAAAATSAVPQVATATLVKGTPILITTTRDRDSVRSFSLTYWPRGSAPVSQRGSALRTIASRRLELSPRVEARRRLAGTERLEGTQGTLMLFWSGTQRRMGSGGWGTVTGRWRLLGKTGLYAARCGRGAFTSDATLTTVAYRGTLITAQ